MQFSRKFLISSIVILLIGAVTWQMGANQASPDEMATEGTADAGQDKMSRAMSSLNKVGGKETPIKVSAAPVVRDVLIQQVSAQGRVHTYSKTDLINEVAGHLKVLHVRDGMVVKKGDLIAEIDDHEYNLDVLEAESAYLSAKADYVAFDVGASSGGSGSKAAIAEKYAKLKTDLESGAITQDEYDRLHFELELEELRTGARQDDVLIARMVKASKIKLEKARFKLSKTKIYAPFDGMIFDVEVSTGAYLGSSTKIAQLVSTRDLVVKAKVLESEMGDVVKGRPTKIRLTALPDMETITGSIESVSPYVNEEDKTVDTIVRIKNPSDRIRPGMFAEVLIDSKMFDDRLMVPKTAILPRDNRKVVFKVGEDNRAKWVYVETGVENSQFVEIISGELNPGEMVLTDNHFTMGHDTLVKISKSKKK